MTEFDKALVFTDLYTCNRLNAWAPDQYSGIEISVKDLNRVDEVSGALIKLVNRKTDAYGGSYVTMTIQELYPQIFCLAQPFWTSMWVILALMVSVAGFTMISGLLIIILERTNFIGIMKALGATNRGIRHIFLYFAVFVMGKAIALGKYNRNRHSGSSALYRNVPFGCVDILCGFGTGLVQSRLCTGYQCGYFGDMRVVAYRSEFLGFPYPSGSVYSF